MEVPHHAHGSHDKKNWKSYISEFLMLFLAVFSGFIAENLREHFVENEKAGQYVTSMFLDMQKDTVKIKEVIHANQKKMKGLDSLLFYLKEPLSEAVVKKIYVNSNYAGGSILFENETGTITQLKNAGGLRLIKDTACVNRITAYDQINELSKKQGDAYYHSALEVLSLMEDIMDFSFAQRKTATPVFYLSKDPDKLRLFYNKCFMQKQIISGYCSFLELQKKEATNDMALLRKKYPIHE